MKNICKDKRGFYYFPRIDSSSVIAVFGNRQTCIKDRGFLENLPIDQRKPICLNQVHTADVIEVDSYKDYPPGDGMITKERGLPLAISTADCLSLFFYDPTNKAIGLVHAGWRGSQLEITKKIVRLMEKRFLTFPEELIVGFGPSLRSCCYQVGDEFCNYFPNDVLRKTHGLYLDLIKINKDQLYSSGIREENILDSKICTSCLNQEFFSYRKEGVSCGRLTSLMMLR